MHNSMSTLIKFSEMEQEFFVIEQFPEELKLQKKEWEKKELELNQKELERN